MAYTREQPYLKTKEVAEVLQVTTRTLYTWLKDGRIPEPERNPLNRHRKWTLADVEAARDAILEAKDK